MRAYMEGRKRGRAFMGACVDMVQAGDIFLIPAWLWCVGDLTIVERVGRRWVGSMDWRENKNKTQRREETPFVYT